MAAVRSKPTSLPELREARLVLVYFGRRCSWGWVYVVDPGSGYSCRSHVGRGASLARRVGQEVPLPLYRGFGKIFERGLRGSVVEMM